MPEKREDHDLIIAHTIKIEQLCGLVHGLRKDIKGYSDKIDTKCENRSDVCGKKISEMIPFNTFKWIVGIVIVVMIMLGSGVVLNKVTLAKNTEIIDHLKAQARPVDQSKTYGIKL